MTEVQVSVLVGARVQLDSSNCNVSAMTSNLDESKTLISDNFATNLCVGGDVQIRNIKFSGLQLKHCLQNSMQVNVQNACHIFI